MSKFSDFCSKFLRWIPCVFIIAIILWSYYAYVVELCACTVQSVVEKAFYLLFYHIFFFMFAWAYWQTIFTDVMTPSEDYSIPWEYRDRINNPESPEAKKETLKEIVQRRNLTLMTQGVDGGVRYCEISKMIKPDRCHYCSVVGKCVLKMDHYCPWVNNCVGYSNYKFFVLFLLYGFLYCLYVASTVLQYFIDFWQNLLDGNARFHILFLFFASVMFAISLIGLLGYHLYLVYKNRSTLESFRANIFGYGPDSEGYNLGGMKNFEQVFGERKLLWPLPIFTSMGDGMSYPMKLIAQDTERNLGNGESFPQRNHRDSSSQLMNEAFGTRSPSQSSSHVAILKET